MSLPSYPEYKDSKFSWLGKVPANWTIQRFDAHTTTHRISVTPENLDGHSVLHYSIPSVQETGNGRVEDGTTIDSNKLVVSFPQLLVSKLNPHKQVVVLAEPHAELLTVASTEFVPLIPRTADSKYIRYVWQSPKCLHYLLARCDSATRSHQRVNPDDISKMHWAWPPSSEQTAIATFLDHETGKIDALIAEQEKLLALLAEKRQATISHAVTKGMNPDAPMKDSSVEWLGNVPAHWRVGKIQNFAKRESGHTPSRQHPEWWENCTIPWFSLADVWQLRTGNVKYVYETKELVSELGLANSSARLLPAGTVMLSRTASVGYSAIMGCDMATTQDFINWVCKPELSPDFLLYVLRGMKSEFDRLMMGSTHQTIYMPDVAKLMMGLPPVTEQAAIVSFLDTETTRLDTLTAEAERAITLLTERRAALIAAAVTGQIDVRGLVAEPGSA